MSFAAVEEIARAVLYEGYLLYPYRTSALKNRQRWMFGRLVPRDYSLAHDPSEAWSMQSQCLVLGSPQTRLEISVRCLQLAQRMLRRAEMQPDGRIDGLRSKVHEAAFCRTILPGSQQRRRWLCLAPWLY